MVVEEKLKGSLRAINLALIGVREFAYEKREHGQIAVALDDLEYLVGLLIRDDDTTEQFKEAAIAYGMRYGCQSIGETLI